MSTTFKPSKKEARLIVRALNEAGDRWSDPDAEAIRMLARVLAGIFDRGE